MTINNKEFIEMTPRCKQNGWTVYVDEYDTDTGVKYYVGQTKRRVAKRHSDLSNNYRRSWSGRKVQYSDSIAELRKNGLLTRTWIYTGIISENEARQIETDTIRALKLDYPDSVLNCRESDPPIHPVTATSNETGEVVHFPSIRAAMKFLGKTTGRPIRLCLQGKQHYAWGYTWQ